MHVCGERTDDEVDATLTLLYYTEDTRSTQEKESVIAEAMARKLGRRRLTVYGLQASSDRGRGYSVDIRRGFSGRVMMSGGVQTRLQIGIDRNR